MGLHGSYAKEFPEKIIQWIMEYASTPKFSISINGELNRFFPSGRGLRQGDSMSPYPYVLAMWALAGLMDAMSRQANFQFHWKCEKERITCLCFADDLMILCRGELSSIDDISAV